MELWEMRKG